MPRTSEKAQLTSQLQDTWLAHILLDTLFDEDDWELLEQFLGPTTPGTIRNRRTTRKSPFKNQSDSDAGWIGGDTMALAKGVESEMTFGLKRAEEKEKEIEEWIGFLGIALQEIRYLAPRVPIPRSEYLFRHYVCCNRYRLLFGFEYLLILSMFYD